MANVKVPTKILFVDDEVLVRNMFANTVRDQGYDVELAANGQEAIRKADVYDYPIIVTDLRMPGMDGLTLIQELQPKHPSTSFVIVTGVPNVEIQHGYGADKAIASVLAKPWDNNDMVAVLKRAFQIHNMRLADTSALCAPTELPTSILLIEDNPGDADLMAEHLRGFGADPYQLQHVERLDDALKRVHDETFLMILADLSLPDARGLDTVTRLHSAVPNVPIVVLSGLADEELALQALQCGAQDYLVKGQFDRFSLHRALRYAMERKRAEQRLSHLAHHDQLTGLANRTNFRDRLAHTLASCRRSGDTFAVMFLDLDRFKSVNDTLGHEAGDLLLSEVGDRLRATARESDTVARLGGDEFAILVGAPVDQKKISTFAKRILQALRKPTVIKNHRQVITSSIGIAIFPADGETTDGLLKSADSAMYFAKAKGRNNIQFFSSIGAQPAQLKIK